MSGTSAQFLRRPHGDFRLLPSLVADLQRVCQEELGRTLTLTEAEDLGRRMLATFALLFEIHERHGIHRSGGPTALTKPRTNGTLSMP